MAKVSSSMDTTLPSARRSLTGTRRLRQRQCDNCGSCSLGAGDPYGTYQPYIDGEMEIADINMMVAERNAKLFGLQRG